MNENQKAAGFAGLARHYVDLVDTPLKGQVEYLTRIEILLAQLVAGAYDLPHLEPTTNKPGSQSVVPRTGLSEALGDADIYWEILDPTLATQPPEVTAGSLIDDLNDIYTDLKRGLLLWDDGTERDAVWEWRLAFETHWGQHAVSALRVVHARLW